MVQGLRSRASFLTVVAQALAMMSMVRGSSHSLGGMAVKTSSTLLSSSGRRMLGEKGGVGACFVHGMHQATASSLCLSGSRRGVNTFVGSKLGLSLMGIKVSGLQRHRSGAGMAQMMAETVKEYDGEQLRLLDSDECILVNEKDEVIGSASKKYCHLMKNIDNGSALHRAFSVFLFTPKGELVLQKRSSDKILFPDRWTNTCCSHPLSVPDELDNPPCPQASGVKRAAVRKLEHELGVPVGQVPEDALHFMTRIVYKAAVGEDDTWGEHEVDYILVGEGDANLDNLNPNEVSQVRLLKRGELDGLIEAEEKGDIMLSPWFKLISQKWLPIWWDAHLEGKLLTTSDVNTIHKF